jgi:tRNA (guanine-N7-)-methyltransferase
LKLEHAPEKLQRYAHAPRLPELQSEEEQLDPRALVGANEPVELEIGVGRAGFLLERLAHAPSARIVGLEIRRKLATLADDRVRACGHADRCRVFSEDARLVLPRFVPESISRIFVHFPDPWWKKRHAKRVLVSVEVVNVFATLLTDAGELFVQTDVKERALAFEELLSSAVEFEPLGESVWLLENPYGARSPRERRAMQDGLPIFRLGYRRKARHRHA